MGNGNNSIDLLVLLLVASPYLLIGRHAFTDLINCVRNQENYKVYRLIQLGAVFILPEFILKIKYGYLVYEVVIYYLLIYDTIFLWHPIIRIHPNSGCHYTDAHYRPCMNEDNSVHLSRLVVCFSRTAMICKIVSLTNR